jgi:DNA-binding NarL/FixJ family response regulator
MDQLLLVEDDIPTLEWLARMLARTPGLAVAHACSTVASALDWLQSGAKTDIVLTDLGLPDGSGLAVIEEACKSPGCEVLVLSIFGDEKNVLAAIKAGAGGYLLKDGSLDSVGEHLQCLRSGGSPLSPRIARTLIRRTQSAVAHAAPQTTASDEESPGKHGLLSAREIDVLAGVGKGYSYAEVASALHITTNTVRTHVRSIYEKLAVNSKAEALYEYNRHLLECGKPPLR